MSSPGGGAFLFIVKIFATIYKIILFAVCALIPLGFAFEIWDWIMGN